MATYVRQSSFSDGDTITAALFNNEFNQLVNAFNVATGHTHDGSTAGDGGPISNLFSNALVFGTNTDNDVVITFNANSNDGVLTWMEDEDYFKFSDDILLTTTEKVQFRDTAIYINSSTDGQLDIVADTEIQIAATTIDINGNADISGNLGVGGNLTVTGTTTFNGGTITMGDAATDNVVFGADVDSNIIPDDDDTYDLGSSTQQWRNLFIDGTANIDSLVADTADINGGTIDAANITVGSGKTLDVSAGTLTLADNQISGNKVEGGTINATTINTLTYGSITDGTITVTAFVDEDNMASNSATLIPTQQSVKAYVDAQDTAQDLDLVSDSGTIAIDLDGETLTVTGGEGIDTSASSNTLTITGEDATTSNKGIASFNSADFNVSSGAVTLATTSTAAELNLLDGTTAGTIVASKGVAVDANKDITGFRNITLTGELDAGSLDISGNVDIDGTLETDALSINGTTVTATAADINLIDGITNGTVIASKAIITDANKDITGGRNITISGELDAATLDISGNADIDGTLEADAITIAGVTLAETISDTVGAMVASNTETGIAVTYDDADNTLDFVIGDNAIVQSMIADNAIDSQMYVDGSIDLVHMSANSVDSDQYVDGSIDTAHIADSQITSAKIVDGTIATGDIADDAVTGAKLANNIDIAGTLDVTGVLTADSNVVIAGNLTVQGDTTTLNTATLDVEDKNITLNKGAGDTSGSANGAGLTIQDAVDASNDATILWDTTNDEFDFSHPINVAGKVTSTGTSVFASLDISGDIDVDGTTNLDVVDIDGALTQDGGAVFNEASADVDFRVESDGNANMLFVDGGNDKVGIGVVPVQGTLTIKAGGNTYATSSLVLEDTDSTSRSYITHVNGELAISNDASTDHLVISSSGAATFNSTIAADGQITSARGSDTGTYGFRHEGAGKYMRMGVANASFAYFETDANGGFSFEGDVSVANKIIHAGDTNTYMEFQPDVLDLYSGGSLGVRIQPTAVTINEGSADMDFRVESDANTHALFLNGENARLGLSQSNPSYSVHVGDGGAAQRVHIEGNGGGAVFSGVDSANNSNFGFRWGHLNGTDRLEGAIGTTQIIDWRNTALYFKPNATEVLALTASEVTVNNGSADVDFRVESDTATHALFVNGATGKVNLNTAGSYAGQLNMVQTNGDAYGIVIQASANDRWLRMGHTGSYAQIDATYNSSGGYSGIQLLTGGVSRIDVEAGGNVVINESSVDADFRVESDSNTHALFVDGGANHVNIGTSEDYGGTLNVATSIYVAETDTPRIRLRNIGNSDAELGVNGLGAGLDTFYIAQYAGIAANEWDFRLTGASREFAFIRGGVVNEGAGDSDFRVESSGNANMLFVDGGNDIVNFNSTQTTSQQGAGYRADGFQREFQRDTNVFSANQSANANTQARTRRVTIALHNYGPVKITIMNGGHYYNNGGTFGFRETTFYVAMESTSLRINSKVDGVNAGTGASSYGVPTLAAANSSPACQIDFTVAAGMTCSTYVKVEGFGANNIIGIEDV
ncbi:hypothetical protein OAN77_00230 [bacterium]|nr:hypothetical protein [bacterium]